MKIDFTYIEQTSGSNKELMLELINLFCEQVEEIQSDMLLALQRKDWLVLGRLAHKLKGTVSVAGMTQLSEDLKTFEILTQKNLHTADYETLIVRYIKEAQEASEELKQIGLQLK